LVIVHLVGCGKTNWQENYRKSSKDPFGLYILYEEFSPLIDNEKVHYLKDNINDYLFYNYKDVDTNYGTYVCIKNEANKLNRKGIERLLNFVFDGNTAFLSLNYFNYELTSKLGFSIKNGNETYTSLKELEGKLNLKNTDFKNQPYIFNRNIRKNYFSTFNKNTSTVLGTSEINGKEKPNFIKIYHGKGFIYLHTNPVVFTNYYLLKDTKNYVEDVFSYLPTSNIYWDPQIKDDTINEEETPKKDSVFKFFLQHKTLTWFLYVSLFGLLLFLIFNAKRKQRAIPIIKPLENTTVAFTQTIASLYLKEGNHKNLVDKKISFFLEKIRTKYLIDTNNLNNKFIEILSAKSGNSLQKTKYLIHSIIDLNKKNECSEEQLIVLHKMIENFFKK